MLETHTMKPRSNESGVSQRRIPWFAIAIALTVTVSGFGRFAAAQQPAPRAQQSGNDASRKSDLVDDEKLFTFEPKIAPFAFTYPDVKPLDKALYAPAYSDGLINKYSEAGNKFSELLTKYQDFDWD